MGGRRKCASTGSASRGDSLVRPMRSHGPRAPNTTSTSARLRPAQSTRLRTRSESMRRVFPVGFAHDAADRLACIVASSCKRNFDACITQALALRKAAAQAIVGTERVRKLSAQRRRRRASGRSVWRKRLAFRHAVGAHARCDGDGEGRKAHRDPSRSWQECERQAIASDHAGPFRRRAFRGVASRPGIVWGGMH